MFTQCNEGAGSSVEDQVFNSCCRLPSGVGGAWSVAAQWGRISGCGVLCQEVDAASGRNDLGCHSSIIEDRRAVKWEYSMSDIYRVLSARTSFHARFLDSDKEPKPIKAVPDQG